ncbi:hypothetical protein ACJX0J_020194, partial [Zea mays]
WCLVGGMKQDGLSILNGSCWRSEQRKNQYSLHSACNYISEFVPYSILQGKRCVADKISCGRSYLSSFIPGRPAASTPLFSSKE